MVAAVDRFGDSSKNSSMKGSGKSPLSPGPKERKRLEGKD